MQRDVLRAKSMLCILSLRSNLIQRRWANSKVEVPTSDRFGLDDLPRPQSQQNV